MNDKSNASDASKPTPNRIVRKRLSSLKPSPENDQLYGEVDPSDPEIQRFAVSILKHGIKEPLVVTADNFIVSGHRRYVAAKLAGKVIVPCRVMKFKRAGMDKSEYIEHLREHNRQRDKSLIEKFREELVSINPHEAYQSLILHRHDSAIITADTVDIEGRKSRSRITSVKDEMLEAVKQIIFVERRQFWPMTVRAVHYALLNVRPLRNTGDAESRYENDRKSYQDLSNLLTRARLAGIVPWKAITDETRPRAIWNVWADPRAFMRDQLDGFLKGYWRDLMQSQPNHIEVIVEKNTAWPIIKAITGKYCIPTMSGRGFSSIDPYHDIAQRHKRSGKRGLILLVASDFDPEGEEIVQVAGRTLRDDFGIRRVELVKVAITAEQIQEFNLPPNLEAKESSSRYEKFVERHGPNVYELEAITPQQLQATLRDAIDSVIDIDAFNAELDAEKNDAVFLQGVRNTVSEALTELKLDE